MTQAVAAPSRARVSLAAGLVVALGLLLLAAAVLVSRGEAAPAASSGWRGELVAEPVAMPAVTLTDTAGQPFDLRAETTGTPTLLFFGYTSCPDVCPVHMASIAAALDRPEVGIERPRVVFVTVDPERDTPERLEQWVGGFDRDFVALTGDPDEVAAAMTALDLPPAAADPLQDDGYYTVGHGSQVLAFDAEGTARLAYPFGTRQEDWVHDIPRLMRTEEWPT